MLVRLLLGELLRGGHELSELGTKVVHHVGGDVSRWVEGRHAVGIDLHCIQDIVADVDGGEILFGHGR